MNKSVRFFSEVLDLYLSQTLVIIFIYPVSIHLQSIPPV